MKLERMTKSDYEIWAPRSLNGYAEDKIKANRLTKKEAYQIAESDFKKLLPDGFTSKDNYLYTMKSENSEVVGYLWFCIRGALDNRKAWLCDIVVNENHRGSGFGKSAMLLLEEEVKKLGLKEIGLHVFGFNQVAINLYQSLGFNTTDLVMSKSL